MEADSVPHENGVLYEVRQSGDLGRYLVASQDIEPRTLIVYEKPLLCGPADDETKPEKESVPTCLGCYWRMSERPENRCSKCGWPVCSDECGAAEFHATNECQVFTRNSVKYPCRHTWPVLYKSILVLRVLLLKNRQPFLWRDVILKLEHHTHIRQTKPHCSNADAMILDNLKWFLGEHGVVLDDEIIRICGIINVNAFSSPKSDSQRNNFRIVQCMYSQACLLAHCCIPNASWFIDGSNHFHISIRSTVRIRKGEMITIAYNSPEMALGTLHRLIAIEDVAHFTCKCIRCSDPTESNTFVSGIKCFQCEANYLLPENPTDPDSRWKCECGSSQNVETIVLFLNCIEEAYDSIKKNNPFERTLLNNKLELFVKQHEDLLHKNHYILQEVRMKIINLQYQVLDSLNEANLQNYINHCKVMLSIADQLMPGFSKTRALMQFFLSQGLLRLAIIAKQLANREQEASNLYKDIHCLQTRSLLYFNCQHSSNAALTTDAQLFVSHIQRQLTALSDLLNT